MNELWAALAAAAVTSIIFLVVGARMRERLQSESQAKDLRVRELEIEAEQARKLVAAENGVLERARELLTSEFQRVALKALADNNQAFLQTAKQDLEQRQNSIERVVQPVRESLEQFRTQVQTIEKERVGAYEQVTAQLRMLAETQGQLRNETQNLVKALRAPNTRGRWGEIQLRRVVEFAGMVDRCDFSEQTTVDTGEGRLRPDMVVHLPGGKSIVVDSKVALDAYMEAQESPDDAGKLVQLRRHAAQVRTHIDRLAGKDYWQQFENAPELVVLFMPLETAFTAAIEQDPMLLEHALRKKVIPASPLTLIALLQAVHYGWKQEMVARNAREICQLGMDVYERLGVYGGHVDKLGRALKSATDAYNSSVSSLERRVLVSARKFRDLGAAPGNKELGEFSQIDQEPIRTNAPELTSDRDG